jgi:hypothetical protein
MNITEIDDKKDLYAVSNLVANDLINALSNVDIETLRFTENKGQERFIRKRIKMEPGSVFEQISENIYSQRGPIGTSIGKSISHIYTIFWIDYPGFSVGPHFDHSAVGDVIQLYLKDCDGMGTVFYNPNKEDIEYRDEDGQMVHYDPKSNDWKNIPIRHTFECKKNTGYFMINNDRQLHGVPNILPEGGLRISAYCYLTFDEIEEMR